MDYVFIDTPGQVGPNSIGVEGFVFPYSLQIEIFTWSASGAIITEAIAGTMPTCIVCACHA